MGKVLLITAEWRLRALVRAQLVEEGYDVSAWPFLEVAIASMARREDGVCLTILDLESVHVTADTLSDLVCLTDSTPMLLCEGLLSREQPHREGWPPARVVRRPFRVGDLVEEVRRMAPCLSDETGTTGCSTL